MLSGMRQGIWRQLIKTARFAASAVLSFIVCSAISNNIIGMFQNVSFEDLFALLEQYGVSLGDIAGFFSFVNPETLEYILLLPAAVLIVPILFAVLTFLIDIVLKLVSGLIILILGLKKAKTPPSRLGGAVLAAIHTFLIFMVILVPVNGVLNIIDDTYAIILSDEEGEANTTAQEQYDTIFMPLVENPLVDFADKFGSSAVAKSLATVEIDGEAVDVRADVLDIVRIILVDGPALADMDFSNLSEDDKATIENLLEAVESSTFLSNIITGAVQSLGNALEGGLLPIEFGEYGDVMDGVVEYLASFSSETFGEDLDTIKSLYFAISDSGVLVSMKEGNTNIMELLEERREAGDDVLANIIEILKSNKRTSKLITAMTKALITNLIPEGTTITGPNGQEIEVSYETVKDSVNEILTVTKDAYTNEDGEVDEEAFKEELGTTLNGALAENGIELEADVIDGIVDHINDNYDEIYSAVGEVEGELTDEQFNDILLEYYSSFLNSMGGQGEPEGTPSIPSIPEFNP